MTDKPPIARHHCRHYSYRNAGLRDPLRGPHCAVGVDMSRPGAWLPCMPEPKPDQTCSKREEWTAAERAAWEVWCEQHTARTIKVMALIPGTSLERHPTWGQHGTFKCPCCEGTLHWARSSYNGHVRVRCTGADCVNVIE